MGSTVQSIGITSARENTLSRSRKPAGGAGRSVSAKQHSRINSTLVPSLYVERLSVTKMNYFGNCTREKYCLCEREPIYSSSSSALSAIWSISFWAASFEPGGKDRKSQATNWLQAPTRVLGLMLRGFWTRGGRMIDARVALHLCCAGEP